MEQNVVVENVAVEKVQKPKPSLGQIIRKSAGALLFVAQIALLILFFCGIGHSFDSQLSIIGVFEVLGGSLDVDFDGEVAEIIQMVMEMAVDLTFSITYIVYVIMNIVLVCTSIKWFKQAVFGDTEKERTKGLIALSEKFGKIFGRSLGFILLTQTITTKPMLGAAVASLIIGGIVWVAVRVAFMLFATDDMPSLPYIVSQSVYIVLKVALVWVLAVVVTKPYLKEFIEGMNFILFSYISGGALTGLGGMIFMQAYSTLITPMFLMSLLGSASKAIQHVCTNDKKQEKTWKSFMIGAIVFAVLDFVIGAFFVNKSGENVITQLFGWFSDSRTTYLAIIALAVSGFLTKDYPKFKKDAKWSDLKPGVVVENVADLSVPAETEVKAEAAPTVAPVAAPVAEPVLEPVVETVAATEEVVEAVVAEEAAPAEAVVETPVEEVEAKVDTSEEEVFTLSDDLA